MSLTNPSHSPDDFGALNQSNFAFEDLVFGDSTIEQKLTAISRACQPGSDAWAELLFLSGYISQQHLEIPVRQAAVEALRSLAGSVQPTDQHTNALFSKVTEQIDDYDAELLAANTRYTADSNQVVVEQPKSPAPFSVLGDVRRCPATLLSAGNVCLAVGTAEPLGVALSAVTSLTTVGLRIVESYTGNKLGLPFYVLSAVNAATAASVVYRGADTVGIDALLSFQADAMKFVLGASAFTAWSAGHALAGYHQRHQDRNPIPLSNEQTWYGVGDIAAVHGNPISTTFFLVGLMKALTGNSQKQPVSNTDGAESFRPFFEKHVTPARMYGVGYILGSLLSLEQPLNASAQAAWGLGYLNFDAAKNKDFLSDLKSLMQRSFDWMCTEMLAKNLNAPSVIDTNAPGDSVNIAELLTQSFSSIDKLRLVAGFSQQELWDKVSCTLDSLYPQVSEHSKSYAFALLEVAACHSNFAMDTIYKLASNGDQRALAKTRRLGQRLLLGSSGENPNMQEITKATELFRSLQLVA